MRNKFKQNLQEVIKKWYLPLQQIEARIIKHEGSFVSEEEAFALLKEAMVKASCDAFAQLKMAHLLLLD